MTLLDQALHRRMVEIKHRRRSRQLRCGLASLKSSGLREVGHFSTPSKVGLAAAHSGREAGHYDQNGDGRSDPSSNLVGQLNRVDGKRSLT